MPAKNYSLQMAGSSSLQLQSAQRLLSRLWRWRCTSPTALSTESPTALNDSASSFRDRESARTKWHGSVGLRRHLAQAVQPYAS